MDDFLVIQANKDCIIHKINEIFTQFSTHYTLQKMNTGDFATVTIGGTSLSTVQYEIDNVGNLLILDSRDSDSFQMLTVVITPFFKAIPLLSMDVMFNKDKRYLYFEFYDLVSKKDTHYYSYLKQFEEVINTYDHLTDLPINSCWYDYLRTVHTAKSTDINNDETLSNMMNELFTRYLEMEQSAPVLSEEERCKKWDITKQYADNLVDKGGVSTDLFKSTLGPRKTKEFLHSVFFGLDRF